MAVTCVYRCFQFRSLVAITYIAYEGEGRDGYREEGIVSVMGHVDFQIDLPYRDSVWPGRSRSATATERRAFKRTLALGPAGAMI